VRGRVVWLLATDSRGGGRVWLGSGVASDTGPKSHGPRVETPVRGSLYAPEYVLLQPTHNTFSEGLGRRLSRHLSAWAPRCTPAVAGVYT